MDVKLRMGQMQQDFANADGICRTCGEPIKEDLATCGDPMCNEEHAAYMRTMFQVVPALDAEVTVDQRQHDRDPKGNGNQSPHDGHVITHAISPSTA